MEVTFYKFPYLTLQKLRPINLTFLISALTFELSNSLLLGAVLCIGECLALPLGFYAT